MYFESGHLYHIYNQGNNRQRIFFIKNNYYYFLKKIRTHILPYADVIAYCLMPNHFHLMVEVLETELPARTDGGTYSHFINPKISLNTSIGIMLRSYTRAINNQESRTGGLFREDTKAICLNSSGDERPLSYKESGVTFFWRDIPEKSYPNQCFKYLHNNPVTAGLVKAPQEWEFSSYNEIYGLSEGQLVNRDKAKLLVTG